MFEFISRLIGRAVGAKPKPVATDRVGRDVVRDHSAPSAARVVRDGASSPLDFDLTPWIARDSRYWTDRTGHVLGRLRQEWSVDGDRVQWPDVAPLLDSLAAPPDDLIRQLPSAARDAIALCDDLSIARPELAARLSKDPSLVQGLLRQANGAFFGSGLSPILRVDAAIDRIGVAGTRAVVLAACVEGLMSKPGGPYDAMLASAWTRMVEMAPTARALAPAFGADPEEAFAIAVLHNVGMLVIFDRISGLRAAKRKPVAFPDAWFTTMLDQLHEPLGAMAAHRWSLGAGAADAIGSHHRRERPAHRHPLAETLFLAERAEQAAANGEPLDIEGVWRLGQLSADATIVISVLGRHQRSA